MALQRSESPTDARSLCGTLGCSRHGERPRHSKHSVPERAHIENHEYCTVPSGIGLSDSIGYLTIRDIRRLPLGSHTERTPTHTPLSSAPKPGRRAPPGGPRFSILLNSLSSGKLGIMNLYGVHGIWISPRRHPHQLSVSTRWQSGHYPVNPDGAGASGSTRLRR